MTFKACHELSLVDRSFKHSAHRLSPDFEVSLAPQTCLPCAPDDSICSRTILLQYPQKCRCHPGTTLALPPESASDKIHSAFLSVGEFLQRFNIVGVSRSS